MSAAAAARQGSGLAGRPAVELAELVRRGEVSATEVVAAHLQRVDECNGSVNAFVHVSTRALAEAAEVDDTVRRGEPVGPLAGVPFSVKDVVAVADLPAEAGSRALRGHVARSDATAVRRLRDAGAVCIGKTNTPEFALSPLTWNEVHGYTVNPIVSGDRSPGGSSGGEAAAVAAGMSAVGLGTDFGGSVRWPAHCTGLSSLRPTAGRVPGDGQLPGRVRGDRLVLDPQSAQGRLQVIGPIGRTVADVRAMAAVLAGNVPGPDSAAAAWSPEPVDLSQVRVAWCDGEGTVPVMGELRRAVGRAAVLLAAEVASVAESLPAALEEAGELFGALRATDRQDDVRALGDPSMFGETIRELLRGTPEPAPAAVAALWARRDRLRADMLAQMPDLLLMPVASIPAPGLEDRSFVVEGRRLDVWQVLTPCRAISLFGLPVATVPVGRMPDGAPIGVQVVGRPDGDEVVLAAAEALERLCAS